MSSVDTPKLRGHMFPWSCWYVAAGEPPCGSDRRSSVVADRPPYPGRSVVLPEIISRKIFSQFAPPVEGRPLGPPAFDRRQRPEPRFVTAKPSSVPGFRKAIIAAVDAFLVNISGVLVRRNRGRAVLLCAHRHESGASLAPTKRLRRLMYHPTVLVMVVVAFTAHKLNPCGLK